MRMSVAKVSENRFRMIALGLKQVICKHDIAGA